MNHPRQEIQPNLTISDDNSLRVYIEDGGAERLTPPAADEAAMLDCVIDGTPTSRLSCQVVVTLALDGLVARIPEAQF